MNWIIDRNLDTAEIFVLGCSDHPGRIAALYPDRLGYRLHVYLSDIEVYVTTYAFRAYAIEDAMSDAKLFLQDKVPTHVTQAVGVETFSDLLKLVGEFQR